MPGGFKIQANYDDLGKAAELFSRESDQTQQLLGTINNCINQLRGGDWIGEGANKFYAEQEDETLPRMQRLIAALKDASDAAKRIAEAFQQAEQEAQGYFN